MLLIQYVNLKSILLWKIYEYGIFIIQNRILPYVFWGGHYNGEYIDIRR